MKALPSKMMDSTFSLPKMRSISSWFVLDSENSLSVREDMRGSDSFVRDRFLAEIGISSM